MMRRPLEILKRLLSRESDELVHVLTPSGIAANGGTVRALLAGATLLGIAVSTAMAVGALATLFLALGALYFLVTQVLGVKLDFDPSAFIARAQSYARRPPA